MDEVVICGCPRVACGMNCEEILAIPTGSDKRRERGCYRGSTCRQADSGNAHESKTNYLAGACAACGPQRDTAIP